MFAVVVAHVQMEAPKQDGAHQIVRPLMPVGATHVVEAVGEGEVAVVRWIVNVLRIIPVTTVALVTVPVLATQTTNVPPLGMEAPVPIAVWRIPPHLLVPHLLQPFHRFVAT